MKWTEASNSSLLQGSEDAILQAIKDCANLHQDYKVSGLSSEVMQQRLENFTLYNVCSVHRGIFSTSGGVQYIGGYHEYIGGIS